MNNEPWKEIRKRRNATKNTKNEIFTWASCLKIMTKRV
jgi:hypothetical protein